MNASKNPIEALIRRMARMPGLGPRSARRAVLHLLHHRDQQMLPLAEEMQMVARSMRPCSQCGNLDMGALCAICQDTSRDATRLCIVETVADLWVLERAGVFGGRYQILGGLLSAIDGITPESLRVDALVARVQNGGFVEVILALSATVDGQATAHYIADRLDGMPCSITRLAHGVPVGGALDYLDDGTLAQAMKARQKL